MEIFSEHLKKDHPLLKVDARVKLLTALSLLVLILSYEGFAFPLTVVLLSFFVCHMMKIPLRIFILRFSEPVFISSVIVLLKFLFTGQEVVFSLALPSPGFPVFTLTGHTDGLRDGLLIAARIIGAVSVVAVFGFSTPFVETAAALSWLRMPKSLVEVLMFTYRYIFVLLEDALVIYNAQKNRLGYSSIRRGLRSFGTLTGALILKVFEQSHNITVAMIQRGYDGKMPSLTHKPVRRNEIAFSVLFIVLMAIIWKI